MTLTSGIGRIIGGVILAGIGYWLGFIGWVEERTGPYGPADYQVTYPIAGIILIIMGIVGIFIGVVAIAESTEDSVPEHMNVYSLDPAGDSPQRGEKDLLTCNKCGSGVPNDADFCTNCGTAMEEW